MSSEEPFLQGVRFLVLSTFSSTVTTDHEEDVLGALDRVVREQRVELARLARREGLGAEDALDCVHDAFCTFLQIALGGKLPVDIGEHAPLLAGIVVNTARN